MEQKFKKLVHLEKTLQQIPQIETEAFFVLNDIAKRFSSNQLSTEDSKFLETIWDELQDIDRALISLIDDYRSRNVISREEALVSGNSFLVARQLNMDPFLRDHFYQGIMSPEQYTEFTQQSSLPDGIKQVLENVYKKIKFIKN